MGMTVFPLPQGTFWQSSGFRTQSRPGHNGIDYAAPEETPLFACEAGTIRVPAEEPGGAGRNLWIETSDGRWWKYFHCSHIVAHAGQRVDAGELIAAVGHTGHVEPPGPGGAHLHLELHRGNPSNPVDPSGECAGVLAGGRWPRWTAHADTAPTNRPGTTGSASTPRLKK
jgi:murein DD-endopeptidase MepM/ murein hydrolase activator NlpD